MPQISPRSCRIGGLPRGEGGERGVKRDERGGYLEYIESRIANLNAVCVPPSAYAATADDPNMGFRQYAYLG